MPLHKKNFKKSFIYCNLAYVGINRHNYQLYTYYKRVKLLTRIHTIPCRLYLQYTAQNTRPWSPVVLIKYSRHCMAELKRQLNHISRAAINYSLRVLHELAHPFLSHCMRTKLLRIPINCPYRLEQLVIINISRLGNNGLINQL